MSGAQMLSTIGVSAPSDFPRTPYEAIYRRVLANRQRNEFAAVEFISAWCAIAHRFLDCLVHDQTYTDVARSHGESPPSGERHLQERALFSFFVSGMAVLESFCYGLYAMASLVNAAKFPMTTPAELKAIDPWVTRDKFRSRYGREPLSKSLDALLDSSEWQAWREVRNVLSHRSSPGRTFRRTLTSGFGPASSSTAGPTTWDQFLIVIDIDTTATRRAWLAEQLSNLVQGADQWSSKLL
jgi:hypothetical protein